MLKDLDKRLIQTLELDAQLGEETLASFLGIDLEVVQERLHYLLTTGIVGPSNAVINTTRLGFSGYGVFVKMKASKKNKRGELVDFLKDNPFVYWISTNKQVYDLIFAVQARDNGELNEIISFIISKFNDVIEEYDLATRLQFNHFHRKYLSSEKTSERDVIWGKDYPPSSALSDDERYVLNILSAMGDCRPEEIAQKTNILVDEVLLIIKNLEDKNIITGYHLVVHPEKYGYDTYQILVTSFINDKNFSNGILDFCASSPNVTVLVQSIGAWNYEITVEVESEESLQTLLSHIRETFPFIDRLQVIPVENYYEKYCLGFPPIKEFGNDVVLNDLQDEDFITLKELVRRSHQPPLDFDYCEGYLIQAVRNSPKVAYIDSNIAFVTRKLPEQGGNYVIVLADGFDQVGVYNKLCKHLYDESLKPVILKNIGEELEIKLKKQKNFRDYAVEEAWDDYARHDDNTFPQIIIHNKTFLGLDGPEYQNIREKLNWFDRRYNLEVVPYKTEHYEIFDRILDTWAEQMHNMHGVPKSELIKSHSIFRETKDFYFQYLLRDKKSQQWVGYLCASTSSELVCGFNALLNDFNVPELYRKMMYKMIEISARLGFTYTNLQGSETLEQFQTKEWFVPKKLIYKKHLVYDEGK